MPNQDWFPVEEPGPDYVALVIEWDDIGDTDNEITGILERPRVDSSLFKTIAIGAAALGALLFARWGIHRLRHG
jgi:hypothetical protein